jgi:hypothetical protein
MTIPLVADVKVEMVILLVEFHPGTGKYPPL